MDINLKPCHKGRTTHGLFRDNKGLFNVWQTMKARCENRNREKYKDYGGRGIKVCDEWHDPANFVRWALNNGYAQGLQLDRIDNDGNYCPENCRFVTPKENSRNRRNTKVVMINGEKMTVAEVCERIGLSPFTAYWWIRQKGEEYASRRIEQRYNAWNRRADDETD